MDLKVPARWPPGVLGPAALTGIICGLIIAYSPESRSVAPFSWLYAIGITIFRSELGIKIVMNLGVTAHVLEALYILQWCRSKRISGADSWGWFFMTLLVGFVAIADLKKQVQLAEKTRR